MDIRTFIEPKRSSTCSRYIWCLRHPKFISCCTGRFPISRKLEFQKETIPCSDFWVFVCDNRWPIQDTIMIPSVCLWLRHSETNIAKPFADITHLFVDFICDFPINHDAITAWCFFVDQVPIRSYNWHSLVEGLERVRSSLVGPGRR